MWLIILLIVSVKMVLVIIKSMSNHRNSSAILGGHKIWRDWKLLNIAQKFVKVPEIGEMSQEIGDDGEEVAGQAQITLVLARSARTPRRGNVFFKIWPDFLCRISKI